LNLAFNQLWKIIPDVIEAEIFDNSKAWVVNIACQKPTVFGLSAELWYPTILPTSAQWLKQKAIHVRQQLLQAA